MGFFTLEQISAIEEIKATVKQLNKDLLILADMVGKVEIIVHCINWNNGCFWSNY